MSLMEIFITMEEPGCLTQSLISISITKSHHVPADVIQRQGEHHLWSNCQKDVYKSNHLVFKANFHVEEIQEIGEQTKETNEEVNR